MSLDLKQKESFLSSFPALLLTRGQFDARKTEKAVSFATTPSLEEVLDQIGPLPKEALFLGQAEDERPVLLDLWDPLPGPILILGDAGAGKTNLLKVLARFIVSTHHPQEIQFGVITDRSLEWQDQVDFPHCVGLFSMEEKGAADFIRALAIWTGMKKINRQSVLLMIDGLDGFAGRNGAVDHDIHKILSHGPASRIWPIVTINPNQCGQAGAWLKYFHTRIFGYAEHADLADDNCLPDREFETLSKGLEFRLKENSRWIKFQIPGI